MVPLKIRVTMFACINDLSPATELKSTTLEIFGLGVDWISYYRYRNFQNILNRHECLKVLQRLTLKIELKKMFI